MEGVTNDNPRSGKKSGLEGKASVKGCGCALIVAAALAVGTYIPINSYFGSKEITTTIRGTEVKRYNGTDKYLIFTDEGVFENTDAWYRLKFGSSDLQAKAMKLNGNKAKISEYGWRVPLSSSYPNVVGIEEVEEVKDSEETSK
jgi:hypothetical protein